MTLYRNPFAFVGSNSLEDNFIGRKEAINVIKDRILTGGQMTSLVGLPRMGKTSLIWHMFQEDGRREWWLLNYRIIPIFTDMSTQPTAKNLWWAIAINVSLSLVEMADFFNNVGIVVLNEINQNLKEICKKEDSADRYHSLEMCLIEIKEKLSVQFLFIIDELDYMWKNHFSQDEFHQVRSLSSFGHVVTCSRRTPSHIEKMALDSNYFSNKTKIIWIRPFTTEEVNEYWNHFSQYFAELTQEEFELYKILVERYAGSHPNMMNIMNDAAFESGNLVMWHQTMNTSEKFEVERKFRFSLEEAFKEQMKYIEEQELKETALRLVLEGVELPPNKEIIDLQNYGFIKIVHSDFKKAIFGYDMGPTTLDGQHRYVCMSQFFSHLMKEEYSPTISGLELLKATERKMQLFIKELLKKEFGDDCMESKETEDSEYYKEKWEQYFEPEADTNNENDEKYQREIKFWKQRRYSRLERVRNGCRPPSERPPIDTLSSFDIGGLIYTFFDKKKVWSEEASNYASRWKNDFFKWEKWRNAEQHFYVEEKTDIFIKKAENSCKKICEDIDNWMKQEMDGRIA